MARRTRRPAATRAQTLQPVTTRCPACGHTLWADYANYRTVTTLDGILRLTLRIRHCPDPSCARFAVPYRPEAEGHFALPHHEFGLDVIALVGRLRYAEHRSAPEIHQELRRRGLAVAQRTVTNLLDRYDDASYRPGLFVCYQRAGVPRTNNALERLFGSHRYQERRSSGRKHGSPALVVRGAVRVVTAWATRRQPDEVLRLGPAALEQWRQQRAALEPRREARRQQRRFRRDPAAYLGHWEQRLLQLSLPP